MKQSNKPPEIIRLSKYVAHAGVASRRNSAELIKQGKIYVNGKVEKNPAYEVQTRDRVQHQGKVLQPSLKRYILLNKPKNTITTTNDENDRRTVMDCLRLPSHLRLFPVGRLDRDTTGLLLITNDGDLSQDMAHPSKSVGKLYKVELDRPLSKQHFIEISSGEVVLEDGPVPVDNLAYVDDKDRRIMGIKIHLGRNRIVRRLFEHFGYKVRHLDRTMYAGLTKKDLPRGKWRDLTIMEVRKLKHFNIK